MSTQICVLLSVIFVCITIIICDFLDKFSDITDYTELKINRSKYERHKEIIDKIKFYVNSNMSYKEMVDNIRKLTDNL